MLSEDLTWVLLPSAGLTCEGLLPSADFACDEVLFLLSVLVVVLPSPLLEEFVLPDALLSPDDCEEVLLFWSATLTLSVLLFGLSRWVEVYRASPFALSSGREYVSL